MQQSQKSEPFFKPITTEHNYEFSTGKIHSRGGQQNTFEVSRQDHDLAVNGERLASLHAKLHQEADKIRKWKNQTEIDVKQKEKKIQEANQTIDSLRKSILELQLQNENLSMNFKEEINNREEILQSVAATRNLCSALKEHLVRTDRKIADCEAEKTKILHLEEEHIRQFETLSENFKSLELERINEYKKVTNQLSMITEEKDRLNTDLQQKTLEAEVKLKDLYEKLEQKDVEIKEIQKQVQKSNDIIHSLEQNADKLMCRLQQTEEENNFVKSKYDGVCRQLDLVQLNRTLTEEKLQESMLEVEQLTIRRSDLQTKLDTCLEEHTQQLQLLHSELHEHQRQLNQKHEILQFLESDLKTATSKLEEVQISKDMLVINNTTLENRVRELERQNMELQSELEQNHVAINQMSGTLMELQNQHISRQEEEETLLFQLNEIKSQLTAVESEKNQLYERLKMFENDILTQKVCITDLQREHNEKSQQIETLRQQIHFLEETLKIEQFSHGKTKKELNSVQSALGHCQQEMIMKHKELESLQQELDILNAKNSSLMENLNINGKTEDSLRKELEELESELSLLRETNAGLLEERQQNDEALHGKLISKEKTASDLDVKNKTLRSELTAKNKEIKDLEKEIKTMKSKLTLNTKLLEGKDAELSCLQSSLQDEMSRKTVLERKIQEMEKQTAQMQTEVQHLKELADQCTSEKEDMYKQCEGQKSEMTSIMQNYKSDHDKQMAKKEKEIKALKYKLEITTNKHKTEDDQTLKLQNEVTLLRKTISESGHQMESLQRNYGMKETMVQQLEKENLKKKEELKGLQQQLEKLFIKKTTTTVVQTSPFPDKTYNKHSSKIPTPQLPPKAHLIINQSDETSDERKTSTMPRTPQPTTTPSCLKTPQRSILKTPTGNSSSKKRKVVFTTRLDDEESGESLSFEVMDLAEGNGHHSGTPLILKHSPKPRTPVTSCEVKKKSAIPLTRTPRGQAVDLEKKQQLMKNKREAANLQSQCQSDEEKPPQRESITEKSLAVRKAPQKSAGKFFKNSVKDRTEKQGKDKDMSWFENDDIFGFPLED